MGRAEQPTRIAVLTAVLLVLFGGVGFGGVEVGASRGGGASSWFWAQGGGCASTRREIEQGYHETFRAEGHVDVDVAQAPGLSLGAGAGYLLTDETFQSAVWTLDDASGVWQLGSTVDRRTVRQRYWLGLRVGYQSEYVQVRGLIGLARLVSSAPWEPDANIVLRTELALGRFGVAAYRNRIEWFGGTQVRTLAQELSVFHGALLLGGDLPGVEMGLRLGFNPKDVVDTRVEVRLVSAAHWRIQPWAVANVDPARPTDHWSVQAGAMVLFGRRPRFSERFRHPPKPPRAPDPARDDDPVWDGPAPDGLTRR